MFHSILGEYARHTNANVPSLELRSSIILNSTVSSFNYNSEPIWISDTYIYHSGLQPQTSYEGFQLTNCDLIDSIMLYGSNTQDGQLKIVGSNILNFTIRVLHYIPREARSIVIIKSVVRDFALLFFDSQSSSNRQGLAFEHSTINNITVKGISTSTPSYSYSGSNFAVQLIVRNCTFHTGNLALGYSSDYVSIEDSRLQDVNITKPHLNDVGYGLGMLNVRNTSFKNGVIKLLTSNVGIAYSKITLASTPLQMGGISSISCSSIRPSPSNQEANQIGVNAIALQMTQSSISNFYIGLRVKPPTENSVAISRSSFHANQLYNIDNVGAYNVNAQGNWWGTANGAAIRNKMNDYWHDTRFGQVVYTNYSPTVLQAETGCALYNPSIYSTFPPTLAFRG